jgi:hypothetical protein
MSYYVYVNTTVHKARIHFSHCRWCNDGNGVHDYDSGENGGWLGPLPTYQAAHAEAEATGQPVSDCRKCCPH